MQNPIGEADLEWILHRNCEGTEQLQSKNEKESDMENKKYAYWLHRMPEAGDRTIRELLRRYHTPFEVYGAVRRRSKGVLEVLTETRMDEAAEYTRSYDLNREYEELLQKGIRFLTAEDEDYPQRLRKIPSAPYALYVLGKLPPENLSAVAMIGARECSEYGIYVAKNFAKELGAHGIPIISGMARGIDSISQEAALQGGGRTYAVLGCGVDICYPKSSRRLYERILEQGGILSTFPPGTEPIKRLFPERNRIVSGLADVILVVEARQKSGTFITVDMALEQGREVYAIPGRLTDRLSDGCNLLLQQGALIAVSPKDLLQHLLPGQMELPLENPQKETENIRGVDDARSVEDTRSMEDAGNMEDTRSMNDTRSMEDVKSMGDTGSMEDAKSMEDVRSMENIGNVEGAWNADVRLRILLEILDFLPKSVEEIRTAYEKKTKAAVTTPEILCMLMELCMEGTATQVSGNYFAAQGPTASQQF